MPSHQRLWEGTTHDKLRLQEAQRLTKSFRMPPFPAIVGVREHYLINETADCR